MYMARNAAGAAARRIRNRYERNAEQSPALLEQLQDAAQADVGLRDEVALARTMLDMIVAQFARLHARNNGAIEPNTFLLLGEQLRQVQRIVKDAADIEAKRDDQRLSAAHVLLLMSSLRDDLTAQLGAAFGPDAATLVGDTFARAKWPDALDDETLREALSAPAAYKVQFRVIEKGPDEQPRERDEALEFDDVLKLAPGPEATQSPRNVGQAGVTDAVAAASVNVPRPSPLAPAQSAPVTFESVAQVKLANMKDALAALTRKG